MKCGACQMLGLTRKKKREACLYESMDWLAEDLIILDEAGAHLAMANLYGRCPSVCPSDQRIRFPVPLNKGTRVSMIAAISTQCVEAALYGEWATDTEIFKGFVRPHGLPNLRPGKRLVMDPVAFHKNRTVIHIIEATGATVLLLPTYFPIFSPVQNLGSQIKHDLRNFGPRTFTDFKKTIHQAFSFMTQRNFLASFKHCRYNLN